MDSHLQRDLSHAVPARACADHLPGSTSNLTANGDARFTTTSSGQPVAQLTKTGPDDQDGSVFANTPVNISSFTTTFTFTQSTAGPGIALGDGISFIIQNSPAHLVPQPDYGDTMLRLAPTPGIMKVVSSFTPSNSQHLAIKDLDLGTAGTLVLPTFPGTAHPVEAIELAKNGSLDLVDAGNMGGLNPPLQSFSVDSVNNTSRLSSLDVWVSMAFYNNTLYIHPGDSPAEAFRMVLDPATNTMVFDPTPIATAGPSDNPMGDSLTVSSSGAANGIVWGLDNIANTYHGPTRLYAYNATNLAPLFDSTANPANQAGGAVKFTVPAVAGGEVFVGTENELDVYGLLSSRPRGGTIPAAILQRNYSRQLHRTA